jgi:phosphoadenosine phosphosulfate reductase
MYSYTYDEQTGGILFNSTPTGFSKEPRPVYSRELDILGFDKHWKYDKQNVLPYIWAEANNYYYRGRLVAKLKGGNLYNAPEIIIPEEPVDPKMPDGKRRPVLPEPIGKKLRPIEIAAMVEKNSEMLDIIEQTTVKKILAVYTKYKKKLDVFHVAFSGGKDSIVLLDLVKKALPKGSFVVVFGDTGMEFPDTYKAVEETRIRCEDEGIAFYTAKSHLDAMKSWELFGPPSRVQRWCCSVHKSTPQTLKLREVTGKNDYVGLDYVGVRAHESFARSDYEYENYGKKQKGQYSHNSILEWTSAEVWLYIYANGLTINETYKKGNSRAGCLFCPMSSGMTNFMRRSSYTVEIDRYIEIIKNANSWDSDSKSDTETYITNGGWDNRRSGRGIRNNILRYSETCKNGLISIDIKNPKSDWREWINTIGTISITQNSNVLVAGNLTLDLIISQTKDGYTVRLPEELMKDNPTIAKLIRQVFRKAAYCVGCKVCETNCKHNCISFDAGTIKVTDCLHCHDCHNISYGCLVFDSLKIPQGEKKMKSINCFDDHAPKKPWLIAFFDDKDKFFTENDLGPNQFTKFKRFLKDGDLMEKNHFTPFAELISQIGWDTDTAQGLILVNLAAENPQIQWYIQNLEVGRSYPRKNVEEMLTALDIKEKEAKSIVKSFKRLTEIPLGTKLNFGYVSDDGDLARMVCSVSDPCVILYSLYKFAEKCNDYKEFTLTTLLNHSIDRDGISPTQIFGLDRAGMTPILLGLSAKYPEFINATFTNDLDKISLKEDKTSTDVLGLF